MIEADNTFNGIFGDVPAKPQQPEPLEASVQEPILEENELNSAEKPIRKRGRRRKGNDSTDGATADKTGHFSCICDKDLIAKVRAIAWQEHMTVRAVVESMFTKCIAKYEKKRGPIQIEPSQPSEELF